MPIDRRKRIVASGYDHLGTSYLAWAAGITDDPRTRMLGEFAGRLGPGSRVLDLGCGAGIPSTKWLAERFDVTGIDVSDGQVDAARRNVPEASFICADLADVDFAPGR